MSTPPLSCLGAVAIELKPQSVAACDALSAAAAGELAAALALDLAKFLPSGRDGAGLDFALACALFDPVELLRPGWPLHAELERLVARAPGAAGGRAIGFGAGGEGLPANLRPDPEHRAGPLRVLPWLLRGEADAIARAGDELEQRLLDEGMVAAATALKVQDGFGAEVEHVRLLTLHDLAAMMAMQYEHAGLAPLWPLLEAALLAPADEEWLDAPPEPLLRYAGGAARIAMLDAEAWFAAGFAPADAAGDAARLERAYARFQMRERQFAAVLAAHGVAVTFDHCPVGRDPREVLRA